MRCILESRSHFQNCFITLTYNDENLPEFGSLNREHLTKFFKRLRKNIGPFSYYACGEYGDNTDRAHYHACLFGMDFPDKLELKRSGENILYHSLALDQVWGHGHCTVAPLTFETAAYCARYVMKKQGGKKPPRYVHLDEATGELVALVQPFAAMSLRPAIAKRWVEKYGADIYRADKDFLVMRGKKMKPAKYFDRIYDTIDPAKIERVKKKRREEGKKMTPDELRAHEKITHAKIQTRRAI